MYYFMCISILKAQSGNIIIELYSLITRLKSLPPCACNGLYLGVLEQVEDERDAEL